MTSVVRSSANLDWLDEELRKEKSRVAALQDLVDKQQVVLVDQAQRILALEDRLAKLQAEVTRTRDVEQSLQYTRDELVLLIAELRDEQQKRETEFLRNRQAEREKDIRTLQEIQLTLEQFGAIEQELAVRKAEEQRLNEASLRVGQELGSLKQHITQGDSTQRQLNDAIQRTTLDLRKAEELLNETSKSLQDQQARTLILDDALGRQGQSIAELEGFRRELTEQQEEFLETQRRSERSRAQALAEWARKLQEYDHQIETWSENLRHFADQHDRSRRVLRETQELSQEIGQRQDQLRQMQRVSDEQIRREFREWQSENDRRWALETDQRERTLAEQTHMGAQQDDRLTVLEEWQEEVKARLVSLGQALDELRIDMDSENHETRMVVQRGWESLSRTILQILSELRGIREMEDA